VYKRDEVFMSIESQSSPGRSYEIRIREDEAGHEWLSCQCKSWTTGPYQRGKEVFQRYCKHTDHVLAHYRGQLASAGFKGVSAQDSGMAVPKVRGRSVRIIL